MDVTHAADSLTHVVDAVGTRCQKLFQDFLEGWRENGKIKYLDLCKDLAKPERNTLLVSMRDVDAFNETLARLIHDEYFRLQPFLCTALGHFMKDRLEFTSDKDFYVAFTDVDASEPLRHLSSLKIGQLVRVSGQVVRTHPVHPELVLATFTCMDCQTVIVGVEQQFRYTQPSVCKNPVCNNRSRFVLETSKSRFVDFQKVRIQEVQSELPRGSIPRTLEIILRAEAVESAQPGDRCNFTGTLIVVPDAAGGFGSGGARTESGARHRPEGGDAAEGIRGLKALGVRDLHYRTAFLACSVRSANPRIGGYGGLSEKAFGGDDSGEDELTPEALKARMSDEEWRKIFAMSEDKALYQNLINSLFPTIHGNDEVKRGIMLMLFGGVRKSTLEGTTLRGDINVCVVGDPSTAKSQFLKQVADFSPRAVYTSGKASSAAGLTAAVVKDEESAEFVIEAGALMLADNGICCIDEFDKMDPGDQVAIHEAMEQQTISITKAGVKATLNARTSVLAAANPIGGKYDRTKSLAQNVQMTAPIMSRFDLFFILVDDCNEVNDYAIARRIVDLHMKLEESIDRVYTIDEIKRYLGFTRLFKPIVTAESMEILVEQYRHLRQRDATGSGSKSSWRITVRQLESMIRLSEAFARLHCSDQVLPKHVKEAFRLLNKSIIRVDQPDIHLDEEDEDAMLVDAAEEAEEEAQSAEAPASEARKQLKLSHDEYRTMANVLVHYLRKKEAEADEKDEESPTKRSEVVNWYLSEVGVPESQAEAVEKKLILEKVIDRLAYQDHILIPLSRTGLKGAAEDEDDPILVVHPNYVIDA